MRRPHFRGSILDADPPAQGVKFARRITDEQSGPLWDESTAIGAADEHAETVIATPIPAYVVTVTVNLDTLEVSMAKL